MPTYRVKPGFTHGASDQYKAGDTVELTEAEAAGFLDKLELAKGGKKAKSDEDAQPTTLRAAIAAASDDELLELPFIGRGNVQHLRAWAAGEDIAPIPTRKGGLVVNPVEGEDAKKEGLRKVENQLEAETGSDFQVTGSQPPTLAETDKPAPGDVAAPGSQPFVPPAGDNDSSKGKSKGR